MTNKIYFKFFTHNFTSYPRRHFDYKYDEFFTLTDEKGNEIILL